MAMKIQEISLLNESLNGSVQYLSTCAQPLPSAEDVELFLRIAPLLFDLGRTCEVLELCENWLQKLRRNTSQTGCAKKSATLEPVQLEMKFKLYLGEIELSRHCHREEWESFYIELEKSPHPFYRAQAMASRGVLACSRNELESAFRFYREAEILFQECHRDFDALRMQARQAFLSAKLLRPLENSMALCHSSIQKAQDLWPHSIVQLISLYSTLGTLSQRACHFDKAIQYHSKAAELSLAIPRSLFSSLAIRKYEDILKESALSKQSNGWNAVAHGVLPLLPQQEAEDSPKGKGLPTRTRLKKVSKINTLLQKSPLWLFVCQYKYTFLAHHLVGRKVCTSP
jgi:tetratricopeptide (TPR) repeat protein